MTLRTILSTEKLGLTASASKHNSEVLNDFFNKCTWVSSSAQNLYYDYWTAAIHDEDSPMTTVGKSLVSDYPITVHTGFNKSDCFFVTSAKSVKLGDIIEQATKKKFVVGETHFQKYTYDSYRRISYIVISMTLSKYDVSTLHKEHIFYTLLSVLFRLYRVYDDNGQWIVNVMDAARLLSEVLDADTLEFDLIAKQYEFIYRPSEARTRRTKQKPACLEDLTSCFAEGMTQTEKKEAIMKWWRCGERTARKYMQQFGLTDSKYVRSDYKELHEHIDEAVEAVDEAADNIVEHIDEATDAIVERIDRTAGRTAEQLSLIQDGIRTLQQSFQINR